jgi:hypothetical protein
MLSDARLQSEACLGKATSVFLVAFVSFLSIIMICLAKSRAVFCLSCLPLHLPDLVLVPEGHTTGGRPVAPHTQQVVAPFPPTHTTGRESESKKERGK